MTTENIVKKACKADVRVELAALSGMLRRCEISVPGFRKAWDAALAKSKESNA